MDLQVFFLPFLSPGHMIPMVDLARLFACRGVKATIVTTAANLPLIQPTIDPFNSSLPSRFHPIQILLLPFPSSESNLPQGQENLLYFPSPAITPEFHTAIDMLSSPFKLLLRDHQPDCLISDIFYSWSVDVGHEHGIPVFIFHGCSFFSIAVAAAMKFLKLDAFDDEEPFVVPGLPHRIEMTRAQLPDYVTKPSHSTGGMIRAYTESDGVVMNSFYDMEGDYIDLGKNSGLNKLWLVGPVSLHNRDDTDKAVRGNDGSISTHECLNWLDTKKPRSVIYVCFGSLGRFPPAQLREIALGLEASKCSFIWVEKYNKQLVDILPEGFVSRAASEGKGLVINGWAPQLLILNHEAIGGFVTHCGWNSSLEGASSGVPIVAWPLFAEQCFNAKLLVDVLRVGVSVGVTRCSVREEERTVVGREEVEKAVVELMGDGEEAEDRRKRARELREKARRAVEEGGSSYNEINRLIEHLMGLRAARVHRSC
ncbi:probable UDP-glucosyl transferase 73B6 [Typha angustifolia]|uniref:probable UDP-glucosyl transferase 73B6 n=1 Tax=Typha angustifolia TaxID=59011 RepID=UPI003C2D1D21